MNSFRAIHLLLVAVDFEDRVKTKDLQRDIWRHLERKRITKTKD